MKFLIAALMLASSPAFAGMGFDIDLTKKVFDVEGGVSAPSATESLSKTITYELRQACEDHPGAGGAQSTLKSFEAKVVGQSHFGPTYEIHVTAHCYIP